MGIVRSQAEEIVPRQLVPTTYGFVAGFAVSERFGLNAQWHYDNLLMRNAEFGDDLLASTLGVGEDPLRGLHAQVTDSAVGHVVGVRRPHHRDAIGDQVLVSDDQMRPMIQTGLGARVSGQSARACG